MPDPLADRPIGIAITAMGGQGGGVLADWIVAMAEAEGWVAQATSVPGVAQRTGATIYYVELMQAHGTRLPVLSLMPVPGDVDIVIAAELMEAGRAIQRGLVTPDRTTLIASTHRALSMVEKIRPGDGTADPVPVLQAARLVSRCFLAADMQALAERHGSVISAALFGALAASGALPFPRTAFEAAVKAAGVGVTASLAAFAAGHDAVTMPAPAPQAAPASPPIRLAGPADEQAAFGASLTRLASWPPEVAAMARHGLRRVADYQDAAYAEEYLGWLEQILAADTPAQNWRLSVETARYLATAMAYDDPIRVADLKTRASRAARVATEARATSEQIVETTEFMHPRVAELAATMPAPLGRLVERFSVLQWLLRRLFERPRRVRTNTLWGFTQLWLVAALRPYRRRLLRHSREMAHIEAWLTLAVQTLPRDYGLAVEIIQCRRLVKGYSDTHARGMSKYDRVIGVVPTLLGRPDASAWLRRLREAALADEDGTLLDGAIATVRTL